MLYHRERTSIHLKNTDSYLPAGPWNDAETLLLIVLMKVINRMNEEMSVTEQIGDELLPMMFSHFFEFNLTSVNKIDDMNKKSILSVKKRSNQCGKKRSANDEQCFIRNVVSKCVKFVRLPFCQDFAYISYVGPLPEATPTESDRRIWLDSVGFGWIWLNSVGFG